MAQDERSRSEGLTIGARIHLQPAAGGREDRYEVVVRGWDETRFILIDVPDTKEAAEKFTAGSEWVARYILSGKAYGFKTDVIKIQFDPKPLIFLGYPGRIEALAIRKHKRISTFVIGSLSRVGENGEAQDAVECVIRDLSRGGCLVEADTNLSVGDKIALTFSLPDGEHVENILSEIRNARSPEEQRFAGGVMFSEDTDQKRAVDSFFDHIEDDEH